MQLPEVRKNLEKAKYKLHADEKRRLKEFEVGELVTARLGKGFTPIGVYPKLQFRKIGPF